MERLEHDLEQLVNIAAVKASSVSVMYICSVQVSCKNIEMDIFLPLRFYLLQ